MRWNRSWRRDWANRRIAAFVEDDEVHAVRPRGQDRARDPPLARSRTGVSLMGCLRTGSRQGLWRAAAWRSELVRLEPSRRFEAITNLLGSVDETAPAASVKKVQRLHSFDPVPPG
jgi:hypothetical protein